ncbi:hypothetical protein DFJ63DRAFT_27487 [Scheffersomyces coipomensis]|uniref:uncharacterized protein n=1 Tax=Scheffersomyces coipomensis TaxID=1788519 RepID=UPI00315D402C
MVYSTEASKWKAYQFSDPFAAGSFYVCNKIDKVFCRPDCDARPVTNLKSEIKFMLHPSDCMNYGYMPCEYCDPLVIPVIDVKLLVECVASINAQIGFLHPLLDENEENNNLRIKANILESKKVNEVNILKTINNAGGISGSFRKSSTPVINFDGKFTKDFENASLSKNDSDHYRLVDLACRHLALAAAVSLLHPQSQKPRPSSPEEVTSPNDETESSSGPKKRRRRGGVLGFKELAAKSKLSAWHFHRVFKSVTGLTPKTYGDKCWEFVKKYKESHPELIGFSESPLNSSPSKTPSIVGGDQTPRIGSQSLKRRSIPVSPESTNGGQYQPSNKRVKLQSEPYSYNNNNINDNINSNIYSVDGFMLPNNVSNPQNGLLGFPTNTNMVGSISSPMIVATSNREEPKIKMEEINQFSMPMQNSNDSISNANSYSSVPDLAKPPSTSLFPQNGYNNKANIDMNSSTFDFNEFSEEAKVLNNPSMNTFNQVDNMKTIPLSNQTQSVNTTETDFFNPNMNYINDSQINNYAFSIPNDNSFGNFLNGITFDDSHLTNGFAPNTFTPNFEGISITDSGYGAGSFGVNNTSWSP